MAFELVDAKREGVRVRVRNKDTFASTADLRLRWRLVLDGSPLPLPRPKPSADGYHAVGDLDVRAQVGQPGAPRLRRMGHVEPGMAEGHHTALWWPSTRCSRAGRDHRAVRLP